MIRVTRLNGEQFALNPDLIERVEAHPDTVAFLVDGTKYVVKESVDEVLAEIREYRTVVLGEEPADVPAVSSVVPFPSREER